MKVTYYLNNSRKKNLYCRISDSSERLSFSLGHNIENKSWNEKTESLQNESQYHYTLDKLKKKITKRYGNRRKLGVKEKLEAAREEVTALIKEEGLEGLTKYYWNKDVKGTSVEKYESFIEAIEKYSKFNREELKVMALGNSMNFTTPDGKTYEIVSYESTKREIKSFIDRKSYGEIYTQTWFELWRDVLEDGYEQANFLMSFYNAWKEYWSFQENGISDPKVYLRLKEASRTELNIIINSCNERSVYDLINELDDIILMPICVFTILDMYNEDDCLQDYLEQYLFTSNVWNWETVTIGKNNDFDFYVRDMEDGSMNLID